MTFKENKNPPEHRIQQWRSHKAPEHHSRVRSAFLLIHYSQVLALGHVDLELAVLLVIV